MNNTEEVFSLEPFTDQENDFSLEEEQFELEEEEEDEEDREERIEKEEDERIASQSWYKRPYLSTARYLRRINSILGWRFICYLVFSQTFCKGGLRQIVNSLMLPLFKESVDAAQLQIYTMAVMLPWAVKPLIGLCSDLILIAGYKKRGWALFGIAVATGCCVGLFFTAHMPIALVFMFMGIQFMISLIDLLAEAKYSELRKENPRLGSDASTLSQGMQSIGVIAVMAFIGFVADASLYTLAFSIMLVLVISPTLPTLFGWLPEVRVAKASFCQLIDREKLREKRGIIFVVGFCGFSSIIASGVATYFSPIIGLAVAGVLLVVCLVGCWRVFPDGVTEVALYQVISTISQPAMGSALDYYYTATPDCLLDGPHFSYSYYISFTGLVGNVLGLVGVVFYQRYLSGMRFRNVLLLTTVLGSIAGLSDIFIIMRWNIAIGMPDKAAYLIGEAVLEPFLGMLNWIPISALIAIAVEEEMEASTFAFMAGISNFARGFSELSGAVIFTAAGINTTVGTCDFSEMAKLVALNHIALPLIIGIPASFLIKNIFQTERL